MVIEADGPGLAVAGFLSRPAQGMQAGFYGAESGQKTQNSAQNNNPHAQSEFVLQPYRQKQEKQCGEDDGEAELAHPHQQIENFHGSSRRITSDEN